MYFLFELPEIEVGKKEECHEGLSEVDAGPGRGLAGHYQVDAQQRAIPWAVLVGPRPLVSDHLRCARRSSYWQAGDCAVHGRILLLAYQAG